jgi:multidrug efflux pump subunit AcrB
LDKGKIENLGLTLNGVVSTIKAFNQNLPLGNHEL